MSQKKIPILLEDAAGNGFDFHSNLMSQNMLAWLNSQQIDKMTNEQNDKIFMEIVKNVDAEWKGENETTWHKDKWNDIPISIQQLWLKQLIIKSSSLTEAKVRSEKK
jgi:hypothetical protein